MITLFIIKLAHDSQIMCGVMTAAQLTYVSKRQVKGVRSLKESARSVNKRQHAANSLTLTNTNKQKVSTIQASCHISHC